ncbi:MAG: TrkH family potassium uptake protein, partial [Blautia sp.]|nr:TrkH family potassium uptake protein [Blautia sp.]
QSVTFRTAGFAALPQEHLSAASCLFGCILMFIGGSPVGTAGGIKTVTFFLVACNALSYIRERDQVVTWKRAVSEEAMRKASAIFFISALTTLSFTLILMTTGPISLTDALYETTSALATVGLTRSLTPTLSFAGRWIIILAMYLGRIGPISMAIAFTKPRGDKNNVRFAEGKFIVG